MPLALDSSEIFRYIFLTDRMKKVEEQPTLLFYFPTAREVAKISNKFDEADKNTTIDEQIKLRFDAIRINLCGWQNVVDRAGNPVAYDPSNLEDVLSDGDISELRARLVEEMSISEREKKVSAHSALSKAASNAASAVASA